jgi:hypothetical protein
MAKHTELPVTGYHIVILPQHGVVKDLIHIRLSLLHQHQQLALAHVCERMLLLRLHDGEDIEAAHHGFAGEPYLALRVAEGDGCLITLGGQAGVLPFTN